MFLGYYRVLDVVGGEAVTQCLFARSALTVASSPVSIIKQPLVLDEFFQPLGEATRVLTMCQNQNIFSIDTTIDSDIGLMVRTLLGQLNEYKVANPTKKATLKMSVGRYTENHMFYLDWSGEWVNIKDTTPELIGKTYVLYKLKQGDATVLNYSTFEVIP